MDAAVLAEAYRRLTTGDRDPARPWAYLSGLGVHNVDESVDGNADSATFYLNIGNTLYHVTIERE